MGRFEMISCELPALKYSRGIQVMSPNGASMMAEKSGYRRQRIAVMKLLAIRQGIKIEELFARLRGEDPLQIAHVEPDEFSSYAARSGGSNYSKWMSHIRRNPQNYRLAPKSENWRQFVEEGK
jgi:hypothetical protein